MVATKVRTSILMESTKRIYVYNFLKERTYILQQLTNDINVLLARSTKNTAINRNNPNSL